MRTVKLVIAGDSGVGKTSLRGQYISGRFSTGYRATIGADFIAKTIPHHEKPDESVTLQIWDTAGQERFSSLSTAFFRGADAALLVYDVNDPNSLEGIRKWWHEFQERAPVPDEYAEEYCCVVVGNKTDLVKPGEEPAVTEADVRRFLSDLIPRSEDAQEQEAGAGQNDGESEAGEDDGDGKTVRQYRSSADLDDHLLDDTYTDRASSPTSEDEEAEAAFERSLAELPPEDISASPRSPSIAIARSATYVPPQALPSHSHLLRSQSRSRSRLSQRQWAGTMASVNSTLSMYHTPSSSYGETENETDYASARSVIALSPAHHRRGRIPSGLSASSNDVDPDHDDGFLAPLRSPRRIASATSTNSSAPTVTPSLFSHPHSNPTTAPSTTHNTPSSHLLSVPDPALARASRPPPPPRGPALFFTSAKTGVSSGGGSGGGEGGVNDVFEYVAQRVTLQREYEESVRARVLHMRDSSRDTVLLGEGHRRKSGWGLDSVGLSSSCCGA